MTSVYDFLEELAELMKKHNIDTICSENVFGEKRPVIVKRYPFAIEFDELSIANINRNITEGKNV